MKNRILLYKKKIYKFFTRKRQLPIIIHINFRLRKPLDKIVAQNKMYELQTINRQLAKELKKQKVITQLREMELDVLEREYKP